MRTIFSFFFFSFLANFKYCIWRYISLSLLSVYSYQGQLTPTVFWCYICSNIHRNVCGFSHLIIYFSPQNLQWARDVLLGSSVPWQQLKHMPAQGLFCERNKTNLFNVSQTLPYLCGFFFPHLTMCHYITLNDLLHFRDNCHPCIYWHSNTVTCAVVKISITIKRDE